MSKPKQSTHDFTLVLSGIAEANEAVEEALFEAGCDDATLFWRSGRAFLTFSRKAATRMEAILSAIREVRGAEIGAEVLRVDYASLVTQADIARKIGRSRQLVHQYLIGTRGPGGFPGPVCEIADEAPLWSWSEVAAWLSRNNLLESDLLREAQQIEVINSVLELEHQKQANPALLQEVMRAVAH